MKLTLTLVAAFLLFFNNSAQAIVFTDSCAIYGDANVCENESQTYTSGYTGSLQYTWGAFGGTIVGSNTLPSVTVSWGFPGTGQVTMIVKDSANNVLCTKILNVTINPLPTPEIIPSFSATCAVDTGKSTQPGGDGEHRNPCTVVCDSTWVTYTTAYTAGSSYTWIISGSTTYTTSGNSVNVFWENIGVGTVKVIDTSAAGCIGMDEMCIEIVPSPTAAFTTVPSPTAGIINICLGQSVNFFNSSSANGGTPIYTYEWIFGDGDTKILTVPTTGHTSHPYTTAGTYTAYLVVTNECGCRDTAEITIIVDSSPGPDIFCISTVCPGSAVTYSTSAVCSTYNWMATNGTIIGSDSGQTVTVQWSGASPAIISLSVPCGSFCPSPTTLVVPVIPPVAQYYGDTVICENSCTELSIECSVPIDSIIWHLPPGVTATTDTINVHTITVCGYSGPMSGTIWVEYFHSTNGSTTDLECGGNVFIPFHVKPRFYLFAGTEYCENQSFGFYPTVGTPTNFQWNINNSSGTSVSSTLLPSTSPFTGSWVWGPGVFVVSATDADKKHCNNKESVIVTVHPSPIAPLIQGDDTICPNSTYNYTGILNDGTNSIEWTVSGGTPVSGSGSSINVKWNPTGPYSITAYEVDLITGCKSVATTKTVYSYLPLTASIINGPDSVCSNGYANFSTPSVGTNFEWSINPSIAGSVGTGQYTNAIQTIWNNYTGYAWVVLKRTLCNQSRRDSVQVYVSPSPTPTIVAPDTVCEDASFSVSSPSGASTFAWNFGDGNTGSGSSTSHTYTSAGSYVITLTVNYGGNCPVSVSTTHNIVVVPAPVVNISTGDQTLYCSDPFPTISTTMTIAASAGTTSCNWYKAPSGTSISTSSSYTATTLGSYYAICSNAFGCSTTSNVIVVDTIPCDTCNPQNYSLDFTTIRQGCNKDSFVYTASNVTGIAWYFDDIYSGSNYAAGNNVTHTYTEPGIYVIEACGKVPAISTTSGDSCVVCVKHADTINYVPDFYATVNCNNYSSSYTVTFNNTTKIFALAPTPSYAWSINGGGTLSTATNFTTSLTPGTYNVTLTISGVCQFTKSITIVAPTAASFTASDSVCVGAQVQFLNTSSPILDRIWDFGDGASSLLDNPFRSYSTAGSFNVTLTITNQYGCLDSAIHSIVVLPNNLSGVLSLSGPNEFCFGDSVDITVNPSGGYSPYTYLWTTTASTQTVRAKYTGNYGVDIYDSKGCFYKVADTVILVNPIPNATILGKTSWCQFENDVFFVASAYPANSFLYTLDGVTQPPWYGNTFYYNAATIGSHSIKVEVTNSFGCTNKDSLDFNVYGNPNVWITSPSTLCEGDSNILVANTTSTNLVDMVWSTGLHNDTLITPVPNNYQVTVVDSNGCEASAIETVHRLPNLCGLMTGCYEICDTVTQLVWYAPTGYASYQWYFNGVAIAGANSDTIHIPLYQAGAYTVVIKNSEGCEVESDPIDISFVPCGGCSVSADMEIDCGPVDVHGNQTYYLTFSVNSSLASGANITITSPDGIVSSLSSSTINNGANTLTAIFTDVPPYTGTVCFDIAIWDQTDRCDTTICIRLPDCKDRQCEVVIVSQEPFSCVGYDGSGNPQYYGCVNINWAGANGTQLTLVAPNSSFSPNPITVNNGANSVCFTYTDLPPLNPGGVMITAYFYDTLTQRVCCDSFRIKYKPCKEECGLDITGLCAHCREEQQGGLWSYKIELDVTNPMGTNANVSILPIPEGSFGPISPNPVPPGTTTISTIFTDNGAIDSVICFRVVLTNVVTGEVCYKDICVSLPPCKDVSAGSFEANSMINIYPNPAYDNVTIAISDPSMTEGRIDLTDINGRLIRSIPLTKGSNLISVMLDDYPKGVYILKLTNADQVSAVKRLIIE